MEEKNNEIDLLVLLKALNDRITRFFRWLIDLVLYIIYFILKHVYLYIAILIISFVISYLYVYTFKNQVYSSTMIAQSNIVTNSEIIGIINNLQKALKSNNKEFVASEFGCNIKDIEKIKDIEALFIVDKNRDQIADLIDYDHQLEKKSATDTTFLAIDTEFAIKLDYIDTSVIKIVRKGLQNYLGKNRFILERDTLKRIQLRAFIDKTNYELVEFDSLQTNYNKFIVSDQYTGKDLKNLLLVNEKDIKLLYKDKLKLFQDKQTLESKYALTTNDIITVKADFVPSIKPLIGILKVNFYIIIALSLFISIIYEVLRKRTTILAKLNNSFRDKL